MQRPGPRKCTTGPVHTGVRSEVPPSSGYVGFGQRSPGNPESPMSGGSQTAASAGSAVQKVVTVLRAELLRMAIGDPESPLQVTADGYREAGGIVAGVGLPCVVVQEGGYDLASIGELVLATLEGLEA